MHSIHGKGNRETEECEEYGGHSFRIGAAQALALAGRSMEYTMAMGRWRCTESVLTYVRVPTQIRVLDIRDMVMASRDGAHAAALGQSVFQDTESGCTHHCEGEALTPTLQGEEPRFRHVG